MAAGFVLLAAFSACATPPTDPAERAAFEQNNDPLEPMNRKIFDVNEFVDRILLRPVAKVYVAVVPEQGRDAIRRVLDNLNEPIVMLNDTLQGEFDRAGITGARLVVNTTVGVGGLIDVASKWDLPKQTGDFGQTLFVWGLPSGPYLILPIFGPSNPRDAIGMAVDSYIDPLTFLANAKGLQEVEVPRLVVDGVDRRARALDILDDLRKNSLDFYARLRSLSQQHRAAVLDRGRAPAPQNLYDLPAAPGGAKSQSLPPSSFYDDPAKPAAAKPPTRPRSTGS